MTRFERLLRSAERTDRQQAKLEEKIRELRAAKRAEKRRLRRLISTLPVAENLHGSGPSPSHTQA